MTSRKSGAERGLQHILRSLAVWLCAGLFACLGAARAEAQTITIEPASALEEAASVIMFNHTVGSGANRYLILSVSIERDDDRVVTATYAGQPMTFLGTRVDVNGSTRLEVWGLVAPASGTNPVTIAMNGSASVVAAAISFANVDQANPIAASQFANGNGVFTASASVASAPDQVVLAAIAVNDAAQSIAAGSGQTSRWNILNAADVIGAGSTRAGSATTTMSYSLQASREWAMGVFAIRPVSAPSGIVTNTNDAGAGSLRAAIAWANADPGANTITFDIAGAGPHTITLLSALPDLTGNGDSIDAVTQPGTQCRDLWAGNGHDLRVNLRGNPGFDGVRLGGANQMIRGLSITGFDQAIRLLATSNTASVQCNYLGLLANGTSSSNNRGVWVSGASARIGGLLAGEGNVVAANMVAGVVTAQGSTDTAIRGNFIGTDPAGTGARANGVGINHWFGTGTWRDITDNLIAGNGAGISLEADDMLTPSTDQIRIQRNRIGFNRNLSALLLNGTDTAAIRFAPGSITNVLIGGTDLTEGNTIAGSRDGIVLQSVSGIRIRGNTIARSGSRGIWLENAGDITIGGTGAGEGNRIGGNASDGIHMLANSAGISILGNLIQPVTLAGGTFGNGGHGIAIDWASNVTIGDGTAAGRNVIGGNGRRAIDGRGMNMSITINANYIGTDATGNVAVVNGQAEGLVSRDAMSFDAGGVFANLSILNNIIGGYQAAQIELWNSTGSEIIIQGNSIGVGADGTSPIISGNAEDLISIGGGGTYSNLLIGGSAPAQGNLLANSDRSGIRLDTAGTNIQVIGNTIRNNARSGIALPNATRAAIISNRIHANGMIGIDLGENGVTPNDSGDADSGANDLLNYPQIIGANVTGPSLLAYNITLDAPIAANGYRIEFFAGSTPDPSGFGQGERYLGHVDTGPMVVAQSLAGTLATLVPVAIGDAISATASRRTADGAWDLTSEFAASVTATGTAQLTVSIASAALGSAPDNAFRTPGNDVELTATVTNIGTGDSDPDSIFAVVSISADNSFFNGATPAFGGIIGFATNAPALTFDPATDLGFSDAAAAPSSAGQCTYAPAPGYDPQVRHVCLSPRGSLPAGLPPGQFTARLRARVN